MSKQANKYLFDIQQSVHKIRRFIQSKTFEEYKNDDVLKSAVERQFEIIGEAFNQMIKNDESIQKYFPQAREIISFRNLLIHGYAKVNDQLVWNIAQTRLDPLLATIDLFLKNQD